MDACRILLVEDNPDNFELVRFLLEREGYQVLEAHDGGQGIQLARQEHPDLILMDLSLPQVDGWTAAGQLKADPETAAIPLVALTAHTLPGDRKRALEAGFDGYISKPINVASLIEALQKALKEK
jgi:CheY-like chemotaxis protein